MVVGLERALLSSRLAALVSTVQSSRVLVEVILDIFAGRSCTSAVLTFIEGWMAACRLRLLTVQEPECLMVSSSATARTHHRWSLALRMTSASMCRGVSRGAVGLCAMQPQSVITAASPLVLGEAIHIMQPILLLPVVCLTRSCASSCLAGPGLLAVEKQWARWLSALVLEALSIRLCSSTGTLVCSPHGATSKMELRHRYGRLLLLLIRPTLHALVIFLLRGMARRLPLNLRPVCERAAELITSLDFVCPRRVRYESGSSC